MLDQDYEHLVEYLHGMISDGVQLVHGGHLLDWSDTNILELLREIKRKKDEAEHLVCEVGDLLQNRYTGQKSGVMLIDKDNIHLLPAEKVIVFPKDKIGYHYQKSKPGE